MIAAERIDIALGQRAAECGGRRTDARAERIGNGGRDDVAAGLARIDVHLELGKLGWLELLLGHRDQHVIVGTAHREWREMMLFGKSLQTKIGWPARAP